MSMFPIKVDGKIYYKKDCSDIFLSFYTCEEALMDDGCVYIGDGVTVYPDGTMDDEDGDDGRMSLMDMINPTHVKTVKINRNDLCICGSGKKYKKCCINK